jgi:hypothetical protein
MMNNEGMSSLPVLDAQNNVIGNISQVDVRVSSFSLHELPPATDRVIAPHQIDIPPTPPILLHSLHLRHPLRARRQRRQRLVPRLPYKPIQHTRPHRCEARSHPLTPHVGCRQPITLILWPIDACAHTRHPRPAVANHTPSTNTSWPHTSQLHSTYPSRYWCSCTSHLCIRHHRIQPIWPYQRRHQSDRYPELVRTRKRFTSARP